MTTKPNESVVGFLLMFVFSLPMAYFFMFWESADEYAQVSKDT